MKGLILEAKFGGDSSLILAITPIIYLLFLHGDMTHLMNFKSQESRSHGKLNILKHKSSVNATQSPWKWKGQSVHHEPVQEYTCNVLTRLSLKYFINMPK